MFRRESRGIRKRYLSARGEVFAAGLRPWRRATPMVIEEVAIERAFIINSCCAG
jgi:hypothetical protein